MNSATVLFALGIVTMVISGAKAPPTNEVWPDTLPLFCFGAFATAVGLVLWRRIEKRDGAAQDSTTDSAVTRLMILTDTLSNQSQTWTTLDCAELNNAITVFQETYVRPFVDIRHQVIDQYGMHKGSEIMMACSYGERMLNRVWSASADNHIQEAQSSLQEAVQSFNQVGSILQSIPNNSAKK